MAPSVILLAMGLLVVSCASQSPLPTTPAAIPTSPLAAASPGTEVSGLYAARCALCHGERRAGKYGSGGALTPDRLGKIGDAAIREIISKGLPATAMPAFERILSPAEIESLVRFIKYASP